MAEIKKVLEENTDLKLRNEKLREAVAHSSAVAGIEACHDIGFEQIPCRFYFG